MKKHTTKCAWIGRSGLLHVWLVLSASGLHAQTNDSFQRYGPQPSGGKHAEERYAADVSRYKDNPDVLVLPGLVADRRRKRVEILAECTGLSDNATIEFLFIAQSSGHGYEALLWSHAKPSDVHRSLEFIGMKSGQSYDPDALQFWPEGERVVLSVITGEEGPPSPPTRLERLVYDRQTKETIPEDGFVFSGSGMASPPGDGSNVVYAADVYEPRSIASLFSTPATVLSIPRQVSQGDVYGRYVVNPGSALTGGRLLTLIAEPVHKDGRNRERKLVLEVAPPGVLAGEPSANAVSPGDIQAIRFRLLDGDRQVNDEPSLKEVMAALAAMVEKHDDPHVSVRFDGRLVLSAIRKVCLLLGTIDAAAGIKVGAPAAGQLYYKAFIPDEDWRNPDARPSQPWELHLSGESKKLTGQLVLNEQVWTESPDPKAVVRKVDAPTPLALRRALEDDAARRTAEGLAPLPAVLLIFTGPALTYDELTDYIGPVLPTHGTVHVFIES